MRKLVYGILIAAGLALAACGGTTDGQPAVGSPINVSGAVTGEVARKSLYTISAGVVALGNLAVDYTKLPRCPQPSGICSDQAVIDQMAKAYRLADATMTQAENFIKANPSGDAGDVLRAANIAMATFQSLMLSNNLIKQ